MSLKDIIEEPRLAEMREWFERNNNKEVNRSNIQRYFKMGYMQANRTLRQLKEIES